MIYLPGQKNVESNFGDRREMTRRHGGKLERENALTLGDSLKYLK
jgi:hypothetical protein